MISCFSLFHNKRFYNLMTSHFLKRCFVLIFSIYQLKNKHTYLIFSLINILVFINCSLFPELIRTEAEDLLIMPKCLSRRSTQLVTQRLSLRRRGYGGDRERNPRVFRLLEKRTLRNRQLSLSTEKSKWRQNTC